MRYGYKNIGAEDIYYDGVNLSEYFDVVGFTITPFPDVEVSTTKIPGKPGSHYNSREIGDRTLTLTLSLKGWDKNPIHIYQFWREYSPLLLKSEPRPMQLDEFRTINVIATSADEIEKLGTRGTANIEFLATDPFFYGSEHEIQLSETTDFDVLGGYETWPTIEITGVTGDLLVVNEITADRVHIPKVTNESVKVVVDMERNRCTSNGEYLPVDLTTTDYFSLPVGNASISISQGTGILKYTERYL